MSENSELILAGYEAWNRDLDAWVGTLHPNVEFHTSGLFPDFDSVYRDHKGVAEFWRLLHEPWEEFHVDIEQIVEEGACFSVTGRLRAKGVDSGMAVDMRFAHALRVRDGLLAQIVVRRTVEEAREDLHRIQAAARSKRVPDRGRPGNGRQHGQTDESGGERRRR